jgi:vitamin B12 transporter
MFFKAFIRFMAIFGIISLLAPTPGPATAQAAEPTATTLDEVVVTAVPLEKYLVTTSVITAREIAAKGARTLADALEDVPGLNFYQHKKNAVQVDIRGSSLSYTKIYIDGLLVNPLSKVGGSGSVDLNMFPVENIAKIEIIKGPAPVIYGTDAIGGIILITTKSGKDNPGGSISLVGGSFKTFNGSLGYGGGDAKFNYYFNAGSTNTDGNRDSGARSKYINTKLNWRLPDGAALSFMGSYSLTDKDCLNAIDPIDGHIVSSKSGFWAGLNNWEFRNWERTSLALDYGKKLNDKLDVDVKAYRFTESQELWADGRRYDPAAATPNGSGIVNGNAKDVGYSTRRWNKSPWECTMNGAELQSNWKLDDKHTLTFGALYNDLDWKNSASIDPVNDPYNPDKLKWKLLNNKRYGYYLQDNFSLSAKTMLTVGVRYDENEVKSQDSGKKKGSAYSPVVNVVYQFDKHDTARASYGRTLSFPTATQLYGTYGSADLKPERSTNYELGFKRVFDDKTTADIAFFQNDITDRIDTDASRYYYNATWAKVKGIELEVTKKHSDRWSSFVNYTYLDTSSQKTNSTITELTYAPRHHINYGLTYKADKGYTFSLTGHWVDKRYTGDDGSTKDTRTGSIIYSYLSAYNTVDLKISRQVNAKLDWYVKVFNIFDRGYSDALFYPAAGRTFITGINCKI